MWRSVKGPLPARAVLAFVVLVLTSVALYVIMREVVFGYDALNLFSPYFSLVADYARSGELLLWNPYSNAGSPDMAYVEMGSFSPLTLTMAAVTGGGDFGFLCYMLAIWAIAGSGMGLLGIHLRAPGWAVLVVTLGFMFCGFFLGDATHTSWLYAFAFLPLMVWRLDVALTCRALGAGAQVGALFGLSALAGHPALVTLNGLFLAAWTVGRLVLRDPDVPADDSASPKPDSPPGPKAWVRLLAVLGLAALVAGVVLAPAYLAFLHEAAGFSDRVGALPREVAVAHHALPLSALLTFASPFVSILKAGKSVLWNGTFFGLTCTYLGSIVPALALLALWVRPRGRWRWWLLVIGLLSLAAALGDALPVRGWLYDLCPPTRYFRHPAVFRAYFLFSLLLLALYGARALVQPVSVGKDPWIRLFIISGALSGCAIVAYVALLASGGLGVHHLPATSLQVAMAWVGAPALIWFLRPGRARAGAPDVGVGLVGLALLDGAASLVTCQAMMTVEREHALAEREVFGEVKSTLDMSLPRRRFPPDSLLTSIHLLAKVPYLESYNQLSNRFHSRSSLARLPTSWSAEDGLAKAVLDESGRVWFASQAATVSPVDVCFLAFLLRTQQLTGMPLLLHTSAELVHLPRRGEPGVDDAGQTRAIMGLPPAVPMPYQLLSNTSTVVELRVLAQEDGWLMLSDRWARSWRAKVDGIETGVLGANFIFRAVPIRKGDHTIRFEFRPWGYPWLVLASWALLILVGGASILHARRSAVRRARSPLEA